MGWVMWQLIVTADDSLYQRLAACVVDDGDTPGRARDALTGLELATSRQPGMVFVDFSLRSADTLIETLHSHPRTAHIPLLAVAPGGRLPFDLRRLCQAVLNADSLDDQHNA